MDGFCVKIDEDDVGDAVFEAILAQKPPKDGAFHRCAYPKLAFDTVFRYPFIDLKKIEKKDRLQAAKLWAEIMGRLTRVYFEVRSLGFDCSALGLFSEINKIGGCFNSLNPDQEKYDILMRTWDDMADTDSINFALLGEEAEFFSVQEVIRQSASS